MSSLQQLSGISISKFPLTGLKHVRDLIYFDGPLLSQLCNAKGANYLRCWCDRDGETDRWMFLEVDEATIIRLVQLISPLDKIIPAAAKSGFVFFTDINSAGAYTNNQMVACGQVPEAYLPGIDSFLDSTPVVVDQSEFSLAVEGGWSTAEFGNFPRAFEQLYSLLFVLNRQGVRAFEDFPWLGGHSRNNFYRSLLQRLPIGDRPKISAMQFSSPGFIRFSLDVPTAIEVVRCVEDFQRDNAKNAGAFRALDSYIRDKKLNAPKSSIGGDGPIDWVLHNGPIESMTVALLDGFSEIEAAQVIAASDRPFDAAKIAMSAYRLIYRLNKFETDGLVRYPLLSVEKDYI
jgi:hypothetical protein